MIAVLIHVLAGCSPHESAAPKTSDTDTGGSTDSRMIDSETDEHETGGEETGDTGDSDTQVDSDTDTAPERVVCDETLGWRFVACGMMQTCGIRTDGCAECWGRGEEEGAGARDTGVYHWSGEDLPPAGDYASISMLATPTLYWDTANACGVLSDGSMVCWGSDRWGTTSAPAGWFVDSVTLSYGACGIDTSGHVVTWGYAGDAPSGEFTDIEAGHQTLLLDADGQLLATWLDGGTEDAPSGTFIDIGIGSEYACAVKADGTILCWTDYDPENAEFEAMTLRAPEGPVVDVCVLGGGDACALDPAGQVSCWAAGGSAESPGEETFTQIACGATHACGVTTDGEIRCWGSDHYGETIPPS